MDPHVNPATEDQAVDRVHRLGQSRPVHVTRLIAANTVRATALVCLQCAHTHTHTHLLTHVCAQVESGILRINAARRGTSDNGKTQGKKRMCEIKDIMGLNAKPPSRRGACSGVIG